MGECSRKDFISDLPHGIMDCILTKLPIRDAIRTCVLSTKWRYQWATMTQLVIDENCVRKSQIKRKFFNFMLRCLFMHNGPILKFSVSFKYLDECPDMDQCLRFLSRKNIKELVLDKVSPEPTLAPPAVFSCQQLISLTIKSFGMKIPRTFQGFPCLKYLHLEYNILTGEVVENLIAGCPLLEKFNFVNFECGEFTVRAPNLKHLFLDVNFTHIYLEHAPLLAAITIEIDTEVQMLVLIYIL